MFADLRNNQDARFSWTTGSTLRLWWRCYTVMTEDHPRGNGAFSMHDVVKRRSFWMEVN